MSRLSGNELLRALTRRRPWRLLRPALLVSGIALLIFSSTFLLAVEWDGAPPPSSAAGSLPSASDDSTLDLGSAFASIDADTLSEGLLRLDADLHPTPTLTPTPIPTPTSTPVPPPPPPPPPSEPDSAPPPSQPSSPPPASAPSGCPTAGQSGFASAMFSAINNERVQQGLPALAVQGCVVYVAKIRSDDMAALNYFSHTSPNGDTAFSLMDKYGVPYGWAGENLARNNYPDNESVSVAIRDLMASPGHRANILGVNYTHLGVGVAVDGAGMKYFTMIFIGAP
ncbi:MAG: hypothetical protein IIB21_02100 [Chloroflexi bacterium]|nr:hypothetical protein [Chloroflexota bacterium]